MNFVAFVSLWDVGIFKMATSYILFHMKLVLFIQQKIVSFIWKSILYGSELKYMKTSEQIEIMVSYFEVSSCLPKGQIMTFGLLLH